MKTVAENTPFWVVEEKIESTPIYWTGHKPGENDENGLKEPTWSTNIHDAEKFLSHNECLQEAFGIVDGEIVEHIIDSGPSSPAHE